MYLQVWKGPLSAVYNGLVITDGTTFTTKFVWLWGDRRSVHMHLDIKQDCANVTEVIYAAALKTGSYLSLRHGCSRWPRCGTRQPLKTVTFACLSSCSVDVVCDEAVVNWCSRAPGPSQTHSGLFWQNPWEAEPSIKSLDCTTAMGQKGRMGDWSRKI